MPTINVYAKPAITLSGVPATMVVGDTATCTVVNPSANFSFVDEVGTFLYDPSHFTLNVTGRVAGTITFTLTALVAAVNTTVQWTSSTVYTGINSDIKTLTLNASPMDRNAKVGFTIGKQYTPDTAGLCVLAGDSFRTVSGYNFVCYTYQGVQREILLAFHDSSTWTTTAAAMTYLNNTYTFRLRNRSTNNVYTILAGTVYNTSVQYGQINIDGTATSNTATDACTTSTAILLVINRSFTPMIPTGTYDVEVVNKSSGLIVSNPFSFVMT